MFSQSMDKSNKNYFNTLQILLSIELIFFFIQIYIQNELKESTLNDPGFSLKSVYHHNNNIHETFQNILSTSS